MDSEAAHGTVCRLCNRQFTRRGLRAHFTKAHPGEEVEPTVHSDEEEDQQGFHEDFQPFKRAQPLPSHEEQNREENRISPQHHANLTRSREENVVSLLAAGLSRCQPSWPTQQLKQIEAPASPSPQRQQHQEERSRESAVVRQGKSRDAQLEATSQRHSRPPHPTTGSQTGASQLPLIDELAGGVSLARGGPALQALAQHMSNEIRGGSPAPANGSQLLQDAGAKIGEVSQVHNVVYGKEVDRAILKVARGQNDQMSNAHDRNLVWTKSIAADAVLSRFTIEQLESRFLKLLPMLSKFLSSGT